MNILDKYPVFEKNQVLTSEQLNNLVEYLDQQNRLTRARLIGIGAICGFNLKYLDNTLIISKGIGITSNGFLITQGDCPTTRYRDYLLPKTVRYTPFEDITTKEQDVDLYELLTTDADPGNDASIKKLTDKFLNDKVVLLFLEIFDQDLKTCLAKSCDEIGQTRIFTIRKLLISTTDLDKVLQRLNIDSYDPTFPGKFELPVISLPRITIKTSDEAATKKIDLLRKYRDAVQLIKDDLNSVIQQTYSLYQPILENIYQKTYFGTNKTIDNLFISWDSYITTETGVNPLYGMQYFYDFIKDLVLAYDEFKNTAFELCNECVIDLERFPQHLMLGPAIPPDDYNIDSTPYRNRFIHSMAYSKQKYLTEKTILLHQRIVSMIISFKLDYISSQDNTLTKTYIIPSQGKITRLSLRSLPFYYVPEKAELPLINHWNFDIEKRKLSDNILTYHHQADNNDPVKAPLKYDLDKYSFLRIESVLGKEADTLQNTINTKKVDYNLPFNLVSLKIDPSPDTLTLDPALWDDLRELYYEARGNIICEVQNLYAGIRNLPIASLKLEYTSIEPDKIGALVEVIKGLLPENIDSFIFPEFFESYCSLLELIHEYKLALLHRKGRLIHVLINVIYPEEFQDELTIIEESLGIIKDILNNCIYRELYMLYYRLTGRKKYLLINHPAIFSNFIKKHPGIEHAGGVYKGGTFILVNENNTPAPDTDGKNKVFADFSLPYKCCCECSELPTIEQELKNVQLPDLALPDSAICIMNNSVDIDILQNDYIPLSGQLNITTNSQNANYDQNKKLITYKRNNYLGLDSFYYTINRIGGLNGGTEDPTKMISNITSDDIKVGDLFGYSVDIIQDRAIVGALKGTQDTVNSGSANIFEFKDGQWKQQAKLVPIDKQNDDQFGCSVAISGNYAVVGAKGEDTGGKMAGSVYIFANENETWSQKQKLQSTDIQAGDYFGCSVAISNNLLIVGAFGKDKDSNVKNSGCVYFFKFESNQWVQKQKITASDSATGDYFGYDVALYNNNLVIGAYCKDTNGYNSGCAYVYTYNGTQFTENQRLTSSDIQADDYFGSSVAIYENTIVVGARRKDNDGKNSGCVYVFNFDGNTWTEVKKLVPLDAEDGDYFGFSVGIYKDNIVIGSRFEDKGGNNIGCAYLFGYSNGNWKQIAKLQPPVLHAGDLFGSAVAIYDDLIIISAHKDDSKGGDAGSVYIFPKQTEVLNNSALVQVLTRKEYAIHIQAKDDLQIVQQHDELVIDILQNDIYYNTTELAIPGPSSALGGVISIITNAGKKIIKFVPGGAGKDSFKYLLKDDTRNEISEATVSVFVTKFELTVPDIVYLVTSTGANNIPIILPPGWKMNISIPSLPGGMGSLAIDLPNSAIVFVPGTGYTGNKTVSFSYVLINEKNEPVKGIVHLIDGLDEYSIPDIVYLVTKSISNTIQVDYAALNNLFIDRIENLPLNMGACSIDNAGHAISFIPGIDFTAQNTLKSYYYLKNSNGPSIRGIIHLVNGIEKYPIPDIVYQVTTLGQNTIPVDYAVQNNYDIINIKSDFPAEIGTLLISPDKHSVIFETGTNFIGQNSLRFSYVLSKPDGESITGIIHLINSLKQSEDYKEYFSNIMAGSVMAFAFDPTTAKFAAKNDVILISLGNDISKVIEILTSITGLKPEEVKVLVETVPVTIKKGTVLEDAVRIKTQLEQAGAIVVIADWLKQNGWLICDGSQYNRNEYDRLFNRIGTIYGAGDNKTYFNVPDLRSQFLRGWDNNEKNKRLIGSFQEDQFQSHTHPDSGHNHSDWGHLHFDGGHSHYSYHLNGSLPGGSGAEHTEASSWGNWGPNQHGYANIQSSNANIQTSYSNLGNPVDSETGAGYPRHGNETRPRNLAVLFCIKY